MKDDLIKILVGSASDHIRQRKYDAENSDYGPWYEGDRSLADCYAADLRRYVERVKASPPAERFRNIDLINRIGEIEHEFLRTGYY